MKTELKERLSRIRLLAFDVDGVLTDGSIILGDDIEAKRFNVKDGAGIALAQRAGLLVAFVTARESRCVQRRGEELRVADVLQGATDKQGSLNHLARKYQLGIEDVLYMGDDFPDLAALRIAGVSVAPADAAEEIRSLVDIVTVSNGGRGAVREICEVVLKAQNKWESVVAAFSGRAQELKH
ncbi:MAG TPA: HAD hydrolase family protein [Candidatus Sumerlaeota bacterium]|nr:HAD hydrolase family protein [Candidatus Sumerlaeota bacterium]